MTLWNSEYINDGHLDLHFKDELQCRVYMIHFGNLFYRLLKKQGIPFFLLNPYYKNDEPWE